MKTVNNTKNNVIAYYNGRKEKEVLQYRKVYDIEVIGNKATYPVNSDSFGDAQHPEPSWNVTYKS